MELNQCHEGIGEMLFIINILN